MYVLKLLKQSGLMERRNGSRIMHMTIDKSFPIGSIFPIVAENYIVSEAKVIDSNIFNSKLKIVLINDSNVIPQFEIYDAIWTLQDVRPCSLKTLKLLIPDLLDYKSLENLQLNVRFK